jgi:hypothetical protein
MRILIALLVSACASTSSPQAKGGPRGLRASEHLDVASQHEELARQRGPWFETRPSAPDSIGASWTHSWEPSDRDEQERLARLHRSQAAALQAEYEEACGSRSIDVSVSPLVRYGVGGWNTSTGVILYLTPAAGPPERLLAALKCHRAWMMLAPFDMEHCPLDLPGLRLDAHGERDVITVSITVRDPKLVEELQRRAARDLEMAAQQRSGAPQ